MTEVSGVERKRILDVDVPKDRLRLVKEVAAMGNSGGGVVLIGVADDGTEVGLEGELADKFDPARLGDLLDTFLSPDRVEIRVTRRQVRDGREIVEIAVPAVSDPPLVICRSGNYQEGAKQIAMFPANAIFVRRNTRAEPARRDDFRRWHLEAVERARSEIIERLAMVVEAPSGARLRVVSEDDVKDEPSFLLSRSAELFESRPERLLSASDLVYLWRHRGTLRFDPVSVELVLQSALRKRATLFLWLAHLRPSAEQVRGLVNRAMEMADRDKSDAGRAILMLGAVYLSDDEYHELATSLSKSRYAHMREAAQQFPTKEDGEHYLASLSDGVIDGKPVDEYTADALLELAEDRMSAGTGRAISRQLPVIGYEYLRRRLRE